MAIITISRGTFSGGKELAECVAEKLGYPCIARRVLVDAARDYGVPLEKLTHALADRPGILEGMGLERVHYLAYIRAELAKEAKDENIVYHGHAGHLLLRDVPHVIKVRVIASMDFRIKAAMKRRNLTEKEAIAFIKKVDADREKWTRFLYHADIHDPSLYDLIINLEHITVNGACEVVCKVAELPEFQPSAESKKKMEGILLATEVRAAIASDRAITDDGVEIEADEGVVTISGTVHSLEDADRIRTLVRQLPGVKDIVSHLRAPIHISAQG